MLRLPAREAQALESPVIVLTAMRFHCVTAVASAVAGGAADAPKTPSPASTRTATATSPVDRLRDMLPLLSALTLWRT